MASSNKKTKTKKRTLLGFVAGLNTEITDLRSEAAKWKDKYDSTLEAQIKRLQEEVDDLNQANDNLREELRDVEEEYAEYQRENQWR